MIWRGDEREMFGFDRWERAKRQEGKSAGCRPFEPSRRAADWQTEGKYIQIGGRPLSSPPVLLYIAQPTTWANATTPFSLASAVVFWFRSSCRLSSLSTGANSCASSTTCLAGKAEAIIQASTRTLTDCHASMSHQNIPNRQNTPQNPTITSLCAISSPSQSTQHPSPPLSLPRIIPRHNTIHTILIVLLITPSLLLISQSDPCFLISSFEWDSVVFVVWWGEREVGLRAGEGCCGRDGLAWCRVIWVRGRLTEVCSVCDPCCRMSRSEFEREGSLRRTNSETEERSDGHVLPMMSIVGRSRDSNHGTSKQRGKSKPCSSL
jgi:hypothetical protein